jgi:predicted ATPase
MSLFLITGLPGSGKSTVYAELKKRGYDACDADQDHIAYWFDAQGNAVPHDKEERTQEFIETHTRGIAKQSIEDLVAQASGKIAFLAADPDNEDELQSLFTGIFALMVDEPTRQHRLDTRQNNTWGKLPHERAYDLAHAEKSRKRYEESGYLLIDSSQPVNSIADFILERAGSSTL